MLLKTAVVKPLLNKPNLDNAVLSNDRPISNLPFTFFKYLAHSFKQLCK